MSTIYISEQIIFPLELPLLFLACLHPLYHHQSFALSHKHLKLSVVLFVTKLGFFLFFKVVKNESSSHKTAHIEL